MNQIAGDGGEFPCKRMHKVNKKQFILMMMTERGEKIKGQKKGALMKATL